MTGLSCYIRVCYRKLQNERVDYRIIYLVKAGIPKFVTFLAHSNEVE